MRMTMSIFSIKLVIVNNNIILVHSKNCSTIKIEKKPK